MGCPPDCGGVLTPYGPDDSTTGSTASTPSGGTVGLTPGGEPIGDPFAFTDAIPITYTLTPYEPWDPGFSYPSGVKNSNLAGSLTDPCANSELLINISPIPDPTGDPNTEDSVINALWKQQTSPDYPFQKTYPPDQLQGLIAERKLADIASDQQDYYGDPNGLQKQFEQIVNSMPAALYEGEDSNPSDEAAYIVSNLLGLAGENIGTLSPALISVIDQLAKEILNGNGANIDWSAFADYLSNQAQADKLAMEAVYLGDGSYPDSQNPCPKMKAKADGYRSLQFLWQQNANNDLKKLDPNITPPGGGGDTTCDNINPFDTTSDADAIPDLDGQFNKQGVPFPNGIRSAILTASKDRGINPLLLYALGMQETRLGTGGGFNRKTGLGDYRNGVWHGHGIWQIDEGNAPNPDGTTRPPLNLTRSELDQCNLDVNMCAEQAARLLAYYLKAAGGNVKLALQYYNCGINGVKKNPKCGADYANYVCSFLKAADPTGQDAKGSITSRGPAVPTVAAGPGLLPDFSQSLLTTTPKAFTKSVLPEFSSVG